MKVSILIPCYNRSKMLKECIESFIAQTFTDFEIIVVDDGSTENISFVKDMDSRIKFLQQKHSGSCVFGRIHALSNSSGEYIMPFDSDDLATDCNFLEEMVDPLDKFFYYDVVYSDHWNLRSNGRKFRYRHANVDLYTKEEFYRRMLEKQIIAHAGTLWRKDKMPKYDITVAPADDWELFLTAVENELRFYHIRKCLWTCRISGDDRESVSLAMIEGCKKVLERRTKNENS